MSEEANAATKSDERFAGREDLIVVARAVKTRGIRGEIVAELLTDFPERFDALEELIAVGVDGKRETLRLEAHWFQANRMVLKFAGYDSIEAASALLDCDFAVPESERVPLPEDEYYDWELSGCLVETVTGELIGRVTDVMRTGGVEMLVVASLFDEKRDYLIPLAEAICVEIDTKRKLIRVDAPEGLLEM